MKKTFLLALLLTLVANVSSQIRSGGEEILNKGDLDLRGPVKSIEAQTSTGSGLNVIYRFDQNGRLLEELTIYRSDGRPWTRTVYTYNKSGFRVGSETYRDGKLQTRVVYTPNNNGDPTEKVATNSEDGKVLRMTFQYTYDSSGRKVGTVMNLSDPIVGDLFGIASFGFPAGNWTQTAVYDKEGNQISRRSFMPQLTIPYDDISAVYDGTHRIIELTSSDYVYENKPPRIRTSVASYNEQGDPVETRAYEPINQSTQDDVGDRFKIIDAKGTVLNGELMSDRPNTILWTITQCSYVYDGYQNWTKRSCKWRTRENREFVSANVGPSTRTIIYY
jgi:hypothetical protein